MLNVAVTDCAWLIVTVPFATIDAGMEEPAYVDRSRAVWMRVTGVPETKFAEHVGPQLMPLASRSSVPEPAPDLVTVSVNMVAALLTSP